MYKVFLVDDEIVIRENIRNSFPWEGNGGSEFSLAGEAPDGEIALQMMQDVKPDILITDIRMPFMDGMQLCEAVSHTMPWVQIVILSGYDDFAYAQQAISLGVKEYLLKPVSAQELLEVLERIAGRIREERRAQADLLRIKRQPGLLLGLFARKAAFRGPGRRARRGKRAEPARAGAGAEPFSAGQALSGDPRLSARRRGRAHIGAERPLPPGRRLGRRRARLRGAGGFRPHRARRQRRGPGRARLRLCPGGALRGGARHGQERPHVHRRGRGKPFRTAPLLPFRPARAPRHGIVQRRGEAPHHGVRDMEACPRPRRPSIWTSRPSPSGCNTPTARTWKASSRTTSPPWARQPSIR